MGERADLENTLQSLRAVLRAHEQKHQCEVLYAQGRIHDVTESLIEINNTANEAVKTDESIAHWLAAFTYRCVSSLEMIGDKALDIERYDEAIVAYSAALSLGCLAPNSVLNKWASTMLIRASSTEALAATVKFKLPKFTLFRAICDLLEGDGRVMEAVACFRRMEDELAGDARFRDDERAQWEPSFRRRCAEKLEKLGDAAMEAENYSEATDHFSMILSLRPVDRNHSTPNNVLVKWARATLIRGSANDALRAGAKLGLAKFVIFRTICDALEGAGRTTEAIACFRRLKSELAGDTTFRDERAEWELGFQRRCAEKLEKLGDAAMGSQNYNEAADHFSTILQLNPVNPMDIFIKRSKARTLMNACEEALKDAAEVIKLDPSCHRGHEMRHKALHGAKRYAEAVEAFDIMLAKIEESSDVHIHETRDRYVDARTIIRRIVQETVRPMPRVLIDTTSGCLYDKQHQADAFETQPIYSELASSMTTQLDYARIWESVKEFYRYVMLSHEWENGKPFLQNVKTSIYDLKSSPTNTKLRRFCLLARSLGFRWAWSENPCMDKSDDVVLQQSLVARFMWYRGSSLTVVYLCGVSSAPQQPDDHWRDVWKTRARPYHEYVAGQRIRFYTEDWKPYPGLTLPNHKESPVIISAMQEATGFSAQEMARLRPGLKQVREKLYLASRQETTLVENVAYSLLGIFNVAIPVIHGEGNRAVGRLLEHILTGSGDSTILAWTGTAGSYNSCLPADLTVYGSLVPPHVPQPIEDAEMDQIIEDLRSSIADLSLVTTLHDRLGELPPPSASASRLRLPGISFPLTELELVHTSESDESGADLHVYRAVTPTFGDVEIETADSLTGIEGLCLVHPWIRPLLEQESSHGAASALDEATQALRFVARLRQPFGALLFAPLSRMEYRRVAADGLIVVRIQEEVPLTALMDGVRTIEVR